MQKPANTSSLAKQIIDRCRLLARFSEDADGTRRTFLSPPMHQCHTEITNWLNAAGAEVHIDAAGNLRALYPGAQPNAPRLLLGSHLDTVPNAGAFDGILGVVLAVALLEALQKRKLLFAIEIAGFSEEEGVRFGTPFIGSRALVGRLDEELLNLRDSSGTTVRQAIEYFGLNPNEIPQALLSTDTLAYLEFHIEQGPVLESLNLPLGVVEAIAGQSRLEFHFLGRSNHAGTTPMHLRRDAVAAAAEWIVAVERLALAEPQLVATAGRFVSMPGVTNVIAGEARVTLDVRHKSDDIRARAVSSLTRQAQEIAARRGLSLQHNLLLDQNAVAMDSFLLSQIEHAIRATGGTPHRLVSGAGHDAMILAEELPAAMIFLRSPGGISHDPAESVLVDDVSKVLECGLALLEHLGSSQEFLQRTSRA